MLKYICITNRKTRTIHDIVKLNKNKSFYLIGRSNKCDIKLNCPSISRYHATLIDLRSINNYFSKYRKKDGFLLLDGYFGKPLSTHGVFVNNERCHHKVLKNYDRIIIGSFLLTYRQEKTDETTGDMR